MKLKSGFLLLVLALTLLFACGQSHSNKSLEQTDNMSVGGQVMTIDRFSSFPPEIDGCSCYFSNDSIDFKKGEYVYVNDFAHTSFLKVNGIMTKFTQTDLQKVNKTTTVIKAKSGQYEMTIEVIDGLQSGDETSLKSGTIKLTNKSGKTITKKFYGECGC